MRISMVFLSVLLALNGSAFAAQGADADLNWDQWRHLPVQHGGRRKPLDTLAWEAARQMGAKETVTAPNSRRELETTAAYLTMLFEWQGWDELSAPPVMGVSPYLGSHRQDKWDRAELLFVGRSRIRKALGMPAGSKHISSVKLQEARLWDPVTNQRVSFLEWARRIYRNRDVGEYNDFDKTEAAQLTQRFWAFQYNRMGYVERDPRASRMRQGLELIPVKGDEDEAWISLAELMRRTFSDETDPAGDFRAAQEQFLAARKAFLDKDADAFNKASAEFIATLRRLGPTQGNYPDQSTISLEVHYNHWTPFRLAWIFTLVAAAAMILYVVGGWKPSYLAGLAALGASLVVMVIGLAVRWMIKESPPVTNLYESVVFAGFGTVLFGAAFGLRRGREIILAAAMVITTIILVLADNCPSVLDPTIKPLMPVLRSNYWLAIHVMTIMLSYSAFALAVGIGNVTLGFYLFGSKNEKAIKAQARLTYNSLQAGVLLLLLGTLLGATWADYSWGRFWGWDSKEVAALVTLLGYLAILHARAAGMIGDRGLTAWTVACFAFVVFTWYGQSLLGTGLHNYGLGGGSGPWYVMTAILMQFLYIIAAVVMPFVRSQSSIRRVRLDAP